MKKAIIAAASSESLPAVKLPDISSVSGPMLSELTAALGVAREVLAADDQIEHAWSQLPRLIKRDFPGTAG